MDRHLKKHENETAGGGARDGDGERAQVDSIAPNGTDGWGNVGMGWDDPARSEWKGFRDRDMGLGEFGKAVVFIGIYFIIFVNS